MTGPSEDPLGDGTVLLGLPLLPRELDGLDPERGALHAEPRLEQLPHLGPGGGVAEVDVVRTVIDPTLYIKTDTDEIYLARNTLQEQRGAMSFKLLAFSFSLFMASSEMLSQDSVSVKRSWDTGCNRHQQMTKSY